MSFSVSFRSKLNFYKGIEYQNTNFQVLHKAVKDSTTKMNMTFLKTKKFIKCTIENISILIIMSDSLKKWNRNREIYVLSGNQTVLNLKGWKGGGGG